MGRIGARSITGIVIAVLFSLVYAAWYPMLIGSFRPLIYWYPYWPRPLAIVYVAGGILLQTWFCHRRGTAKGRRFILQTLTGIGYLIVPTFISNGPYQS
jgi:hypothetical protein